MKIDLKRLEELKSELINMNPLHQNEEPLGITIITEALRGYLYNDNPTIIKLLKDYDILVDDVENETPIVKPHKFNSNE
jgi:hypothetical protein